MTFKEFTLRKVPDDAAPDVAHRMYQEYLVEYYGSAIKAEFEQNKDSDFFKYQFDPRNFAKIVASRAEEAQDTAKHVAADLASATLDPANENFAQGMYDLAPKLEKDAKPGSEDGPKFAPNLCWRPTRVAHDITLSRRLIRKLDAEKGVEENPLLPALPPGPEPAAAAAGDGGDGEKAAGGEDAAGAGGEGGAAGGEGGEGGAEGAPAPAGSVGGAAPAAKEPEEEEEVVVDESNYKDMVGKLDLQLHWLWKVHGVDYYAGIELNENDWPYRLNCCRLIRGPKPEEGEGADEAADKADGEKLGRQVDECWEGRISHGDPIEAKCMKQRIEDELDKWIEGQVTMVADNKWGSKLSNKLFVGKKYVIKHIKTKHQDKLALERERILDQLYFENFRVWKEEEERRRAEEEHAGAEPMEGEGAGMEGEGGGYGGRGRGRGPMRGRGRGPGRGPMGRGPMMGLEAGPIMMPMPMAPMFMPPGPMGPFMPIIPGPVPMLPPGPMPIRGRGPRPMRGRGMPGRGMGPPKIDPRGMREYYDLDHPANNRAVLDYGDL
ncbi:hypothetical protein HYH03_001451 [Edaphochlamys debaryana]|uniref:Uncharacterized protein n=1 Tax=Edaphochlamys debaryana TaxID=47281 RepID=A0A835YD50_9CHLO|nr:hypothetical protein HYH03_001451 [Edaphochlamys debaryana]|eukprot:KAG2500685.1 hypothetical protein HYH03_001451 [Edaphochlamys debaryana]